MYRQAPKSVWKNHPKNFQKRYRNDAKIEKIQNWPGDLGADFGDLAFLKLFEEKNDFWKPAERP